MIIDFHAHIYPEKVASKVLSAAKMKLHVEVPGTGTPQDLCGRMTASGITNSVLLPLAKGESAVSPLNDWVISVSGNGLIPFGRGILLWKTWRRSWTVWLPAVFVG